MFVRIHFTMRCLNSPGVLNSLEVKIVESVPSDARHVLLLNAGDGRLARALRERLGESLVVTVVTIHPQLQRYVDDFPRRSGNPWDLEWLRAQAREAGAFDAIIAYQLSEYWRGEFFQLQQIFRLAKPGALVWTSFVNAQAVRMISRFLPPVRLGALTLGDPMRYLPSLDYASFVDFVVRFGGTLAEIWGMLDQDAQAFCQSPPAQPVQWEFRGLKVSVGTLADAYLWGGCVIGVCFVTKSDQGGTPVVPKLSYSPYSTSLLQALVIPYSDVQSREAVAGASLLDMEAWRTSKPDGAGPFARFVLEQIGEADKPKRVLFIGAGWGREVVLFKRQCPNWEWVGVEHDQQLVDLGSSLVQGEEVKVQSFDIDGQLPFADRTFDLAISMGYFSMLHEPAAANLARQVRRVTSGAIFHLEDGRGPEFGMQLKTYSLKGVYSELGHESSVIPVLVDGNPNGMYLLKVAASA